ncbi:MAG: S-layer protein sap precursor [Pelotomaculum sp. PtaB.Bin104]|nr:MAG: S-layer protein sap precursor [Pelotomaculum sp. PtaB.Bin104]
MKKLLIALTLMAFIVLGITASGYAEQSSTVNGTLYAGTEVQGVEKFKVMPSLASDSKVTFTTDKSTENAGNPGRFPIGSNLANFSGTSLVVPTNVSGDIATIGTPSGQVFVEDDLIIATVDAGPSSASVRNSDGGGSSGSYNKQITTVHFIDVGQGDAIYISLPDRDDILIDGGSEVDGPKVVDYLNSHGVDDIELMIATHPHVDHIGGLPAVLDAFTVEKIIDSGITENSEIYQAYAAKAAAEGADWASDDHQLFTFGPETFQIITGSGVFSDIDDNSVICRLVVGGPDFLFTGDAGEPAEAAIDFNTELHASILKVGNHGGSASSSTAFLGRVMPHTAIISVGANNSYGHPAQETLQRIENAGAEIFRTDLDGNIFITANGAKYEVNSSNDNECLSRADLAEIVAEKFNLTPSLPAEPFLLDVPLNHWAAGYIYAAVNEGLINGYPVISSAHEVFLPYQLINRAEFAELICHVFNIPQYIPDVPSFSDVSAEHWAFTAIESLKHAGIMGGTEKGAFLPEEEIQKCAAAPIVFDKIDEPPKPKFGDINWDGDVNILDLQIIVSYLGWDTEYITGDARKSDVNKDFLIS